MTFSAWQVDVICALDDAVRRVWAQAAGKPAADTQNEVSITDAKGVRGLLSGLRDRLAAKR